MDFKIPYSKYWPADLTLTSKQYAAIYASLYTIEVLFGGRPGGGKSHAIICASLIGTELPTYNALLLRKTHTSLAAPGGLIYLMNEMLRGTDVEYNKSERRWTFPSGATISTGYLDTESDKFRYGSSEYQFIGIDEASELRESDYIFMFSRLRRRKNMPIPLRMLSASNPGGTFLADRFCIELTREECELPETRLFIPSDWRDNPFLDQESYELSLDQLTGADELRLKHGLWRMGAIDALWNMEQLSSLRVSTSPELKTICVGVDPKGSTAADSETGIVISGMDESGNIYVLDDYSINSDPTTWAEKVILAYYDYEADFVLAETNQGHDMVLALIEQIDSSVPVEKVQAKRSKRLRAEPVAAKYKRGFVRHVGEFKELEKQMVNWVPGKDSPDRLDALVYSISALIKTDGITIAT